ncbi:MAG: glucose-6-phosphate isomerase [Nitrospinae bacterium]|nr:glucose-6-phosphate isomerase [Nitrospinota bacterium]
MHDITIHYSNMLSDKVGKEHGLSLNDLDSLQPVASNIHKLLRSKREKGELPFYDLPYQDVTEILNYAAYIKDRFENFVVLGIGGSALGTIALQTALNNSQYNLLSKSERNGCPRLFVADNIDPVQFAEMLSILDMDKTLFNVVTKSGTTAETMSQFMIVYDRIKKLKGDRWKENIVVTTDKAKGVLRKIAYELGLKSFIVPDGVGGRFSVFTPVGLLPAAVAGIDIKGLLKGAALMDERCREDSIIDNPAYLYASLLYLSDTKKGKKITVMIPYSYALKDISDWFRQLWAESLGKKYSLNGEVVNVGQTPVKALGVTDQHSQIQLYVEGPFDKVVTFLKVEEFKVRMGIPQNPPIPPLERGGKGGFEEISYLCGHSLNELINIERDGTEYALTKNNRPNCTIIFPELNPSTIGQVMYMLEVSTAFAGGLYNINPFDQPGVEEGKRFTIEALKRKTL